MDLYSLGWNSHFDQLFSEHRDAGLIPARVAQEHKQRYVLYAETGEIRARVTGRFLHRTADRAGLPTVGDWVATLQLSDETDFTIQAVLPRRTGFSRKAVMAGGPKYGEGRIEEQMLAANIDTVFLVTGLDNNFNLRRIERYVAIAWDSGARPVIVLNKADICEDTQTRADAVQAIAAGLPVHVVSAAGETGVEVLHQYIKKGETAVLLGSSGVGKSTIINRLVGEELLDTGGVRLDDSRGGDEEGLSRAFEDVETLMATCKFRNCGHSDEPGCGVQAAIKDGSLNAGRYESYLKLQRELQNLEIRKSAKESRRQARERDKYYRRFHKEKKKLRKDGLI